MAEKGPKNFSRFLRHFPTTISCVSCLRQIEILSSVCLILYSQYVGGISSFIAMTKVFQKEKVNFRLL